MKKFKAIILLVLAMVMIFSLSACGSTDADDKDTAANAGTKLEGQVIVDGSGTVYPLMAHLAESYMSELQPNVSVQVGRAGSSAGFKKFITGETDFSNASRQIKDEEIAQLEEKGLKMGENVLEFKLAYDGLTFVINKENTWATEMTQQQVVDMFLSGKFNESDKVLWSDLNAEWPAEEITFYGPNENHGTYEFFFEKILDEQPMVVTANLQQEYSTLVDLVSKDKIGRASWRERV